jgi:hypothetical protein
VKQSQSENDKKSCLASCEGDPKTGRRATVSGGIEWVETLGPGNYLLKLVGDLSDKKDESNDIE